MSTRRQAEHVDFRGALLGGLAPDGGLYVPETIPRLPDEWSEWRYVDAVAGSLRLWGAGEVTDSVADASTRFSRREVAPLIEVGDRLVLELFHGPTLSFKDHALQVLARLLARESAEGVVLGATSGDTGSAAIEACRGVLPIVILYPEGRVSDLQRRQMTTVSDEGVTVVAVRGTFDDCQALVKEAFATVPGLLAVNSINWARIAAQVGYYIHTSARIGEPFDVVVPTGNFGNVYSAWLAKRMGAPIEAIIIATNANRYLTDLINLGHADPGEVVPTHAPSMDIQVPSNLERLPVEARSMFVAGAVDDAGISDTISRVYHEHKYLLDPHTATAWRVGGEHRSDRPQVVVATAHPAKFPEVVEAATGEAPPIPSQLARLSDLQELSVTIEPDALALRKILNP